jgi:arylformamidase
MSDSEFTEIDVVGRSMAADPETALREALSSLGQALAARGGAPFHMTSMTWLALDIAAFDPKRHELDLCYREVFGGFRPPIAVLESPASEFAVHARARIPRAVPTEPVWHGHTLPVLAREYSPRGQVPSMDTLFAQWTRDGKAFRAGRTDLDIAYGASAFEKFDLFRPLGAGAGPPLWVFIHGGYWQASDKDQHAQFVGSMLRAGYAVATLNHGLCPEVPLERIVEQVRAALVFLVSKSKDFGFDPSSINVAGHSAGGHLAAMAVADVAAPPVRSALLLSGLYDLTPLALLPVSRLTGVTTADAIDRLSPIKYKPRLGVKIRIGVGGLESDEFKWQSAELARVWGVAPPFVIQGVNHFTLLDGLIEGDLLNYAVETAS